MKTSLKTLACLAVFGLICGSAHVASAGPIRGLAKAAVRGATGGGGNGGGVVRNLAGAAVKVAVQQAIPGGNDIKKQLIAGAAEMGVKGGLKVLSQVRQNGGLGGGGGFGGGLMSGQACPSTSVPGNDYPVQPVQYQEEVVTSETVEPVAPEAVEAPAPVAVDLKLISVKLVDDGNQQQGPNYRLTVQNVGRTEATSEITVVLLASMEKDSNDNVSAVGSLAGLKSGETKSVELRLPAGSQVLRFVTAAVASSDLAEADESDNIATIER